MNQEELQVAAFEIILNSGNARATVHEALDVYKRQVPILMEKFESGERLAML